jgi:hypothetical protein
MKRMSTSKDESKAIESTAYLLRIKGLLLLLLFLEAVAVAAGETRLVHLLPDFSCSPSPDPWLS